MYAVKANPSADLIRTLWDAGLTHYDVASIAEVRLVHDVAPNAVLCFMHPIKPPEAIAEAYHSHGVRVFSLDSIDELDKIVAATSKDGVAATDLTLCVRLRVSSSHSKLSLASKFGVHADEAAPVLMAARQVADALMPLLDMQSAERAKAEAGLSEVRGMLGTPGASVRVATMIRDLVAANTA